MMSLDGKMEISIIIPTYNAKETIDNALASIKIQEIAANFEVILVNDCSSYNYDSFVKKYKKYFNIREIKTPYNMGPGGARQWGIDNSSGKYIVFIDSDDMFYQSDSLKKMYELIIKAKADLVVSSFLYERDNKVVVKNHNFTWLHGKIYKREFLDKYKVRFNESRANEDNGFNRLILLLNPVVVFLDEIVYVYHENPNSITRANNRLYKLTGLEGFCYNMNWAMDEALKRGVNKGIIFMLSQNILTSLYYYYLGLEDEYDVSKILIWAQDIKNKYNKYKEFDVGRKINFARVKEDLKDDVTVLKERISFTDFLELINN